MREIDYRGNRRKSKGVGKICARLYAAKNRRKEIGELVTNNKISFDSAIKKINSLDSEIELMEWVLEQLGIASVELEALEEPNARD